MTGHWAQIYSPKKQETLNLVMAGLIPQSFIDDLLSRIYIVDAVSSTPLTLPTIPLV